MLVHTVVRTPAGGAADDGRRTSDPDSDRDLGRRLFEWQANGATFDIVELEVTAGADVAYAHALLRCGTPADHAARPDNRLRLTLGLRKEQGRWVVAHEHHSFPHD